MSDLTFSFSFPGVEDGERAVKMLGGLQATLEAGKGSGKSLEELRKILVGMKGAGSVLEELKNSVQSLNLASDTLKSGFTRDIDRLATVIQTEFNKLSAKLRTSGLQAGKELAGGMVEGLDNTETAVVKKFRNISAKAKAEATKMYQDLVSQQPNAKIKDVGALFQLEEAGATLSPYHKQVLANWKKSSAETLRAIRANEKATAAELEGIVKTEEAELQAALQNMEARSKLRNSSLAGIYADSLARGKGNIARVKSALKTEADEIIAAQKTESERIQKMMATAMNNAGDYQRYNPTTGLKGELVNVKPQVDELDKSMKKLTITGNDMHSMARGLASGFGLLWLTWGNLIPLFAGAGISFGLKKTFDIGSEVEYQIKMMELLGQTVDNTGKQYVGADKVIRQALRDMDQTTQFSLVELSQGMVRLGQAGLAPAQALATLKPAADLASLGMVDLKISTDLIIQTMALFGKTSADAGKIAAQIFQVTKSGVLNVEDISGSMKYASEINTRFGKSLEETLAILGGLAQAGLKGSAGGTALINFMRDLNGRSGPAVAAMKALEKATGTTIEVFDKLGKQRSAIDIFNDINQAASQLKAQDADKLLAKIFSDRGGRTFFAMIREGTLDLKKMVTELENVKPESLLDSAKGLMDTAKGAMDVLKGSLIGALDQVFEANSVKFKEFIKDITAAISSDEFRNSLYGIVGAVGGLYEVLKSVMPVLTAFAGAWLVFKAASVGVAVFQGISAALAGLAPVLALTGTQLVTNTRALLTSTAAWEANGVAMIGNAAASRAAAAGLGAVGAATASTAATTAVAGVGMRGLSAVIGFLANPIIGAVVALGTLGYAFWETNRSAKSAMDSTTSLVLSNGAVNLEQWNKEAQALRTRNALLGKTDMFSGMEQQLEQSRANTIKQIEKEKGLRKRLADLPEGSPWEKALRRDVEAAAKVSQQLIKNDNAAQSTIFNNRREVRLKTEAEELAARQKFDRLNPAQGGTVVPPGGGGGAFGKKYVEGLRLTKDEAIKIIETGLKQEQDLLRANNEANQTILNARHSAGIVSEGQYQAELFKYTQQYESETLKAIDTATAKYAAAYDKRRAEIETAMGKAEKAKMDDQLKSLQQELTNLDDAQQTFLDGASASKAKIAIDSYMRIEVAMYKAEGQIKKLTDAEREYWKKDADEISKLKALQQTADQYKNINTSIFSMDVAVKAAAETSAVETEKFNAKLADMDFAYQTAESAALDFMQTNITALAAGDAAATKSYDSLLRIIEEMKKAREGAREKAGKSIEDRSMLAFEKARQAQIDAFATEIGGAFESAIFEGGKAGSAKFVAILRKELLTKPLQVFIQGQISGVMGNLSGGTSGGSGGGIGGIGNVLGSLGGLFGGLGSAMGASFSAAFGATLTGSFTSALSAGFSMMGMAGGAMTGLATLAGALGPIALGIGAVYALVKKFDTSGTPHIGSMAEYSVEGGLSTSQKHGAFGMGFGGVDANKEIKSMVSELSKGAVGILDSISKAFGGKGGFSVATGFADDSSKDGAWGGLVIKRLGETLVNWDTSRTSKWAPREFANGEEGVTQYLAAVAKDVLGVIKEMDLPKWADEFLDTLGENASLEDIARVVDTINATKAALATMGKNLVGFASYSDDAASALIRASGGIESLATNASTYYDLYYSEQEKLANATRDVTAALAEQNIALPTSREEYRKLVEQYTAMGEEGAGTLAVLLGLAGAFAAITPDAENAISVLEKKNKLDELNIALLRAQGKETEAVALERARELLALEAYGKEAQEIQRRIWELIDAAAIKSKRDELDIALLRAMGKDSEAVALERARELEALRKLDPALADMQDRINQLTDAAAIKSKRDELDIALLRAMGKESEAVALERARELEALRKLDPALADMQDRINQLTDAAAIKSKRDELDIALLRAMGKDSEATALQRARELEALRKLDPALADMQDRINQLTDAAAIKSKRDELDIALLRAMGKDSEATALQRARELEALRKLDPELADMQERIWGLTDATQELADAGIDAKNLGAIIRDGMLGRISKDDLGTKMSDMIVNGIYNAMANTLANQISKMFIDTVVSPMITAVTTGGAISTAISQAAIDSVVANAVRAAEVIAALVDDPAFLAAIDAIRAAIGGITGAIAGAGGAYIDAGNDYRDTSDSIVDATNNVKDAWQSISDSLIEEIKRIRGELAGGGAQGMAYYQSEFAIATAKARAGDQEAAKMLPALSQKLLELAETNAKSLTELRRLQAQTANSLVATNDTLVKEYGLDVPAFAAGGNHLGGWALVGEQGPELAYMPPARVYNTQQSASMLNNSNDVIEEGFERLGYILESIAGHTSKSTRILERGEVQGFPVRTIPGQPIETVA